MKPASSGRRRIAVVVSHPIQHFCPQYQSWARLTEVELNVLFASRHGLAPYTDKGFDRVVQWDGLRLDFPYEFLPGADGKRLGGAIDSTDLPRRLESIAPHVVVVYGYSQPLQRRALRWASRRRIPVLMISDSELRGTRPWVVRAAKAVILPQIYRRVRYFLTVGDANEAYYRHYGVGDDRLIRCFFPIDVHHYDAVLSNRQEIRNRVRSSLGIPDHHKLVVMVGKLVPWKRQADLVRLSNTLQQQRGDDVTVMLIGTGGEHARLRGMTHRVGPGGVIFAGFLPPSSLADYYCAADIYAHCSEREPHSLAISEAIYCGLPVIASDRCGSYGPSDDVRPGLNGFVYRCGDEAELAECVTTLVRDDQLRGRMSRESTKIARQNQRLAHGEALIQALTLLRSQREAVPGSTSSVN